MNPNNQTPQRLQRGVFILRTLFGFCAILSLARISPSVAQPRPLLLSSTPSGPTTSEQNFRSIAEYLGLGSTLISGELLSPADSASIRLLDSVPLTAASYRTFRKFDTLKVNMLRQYVMRGGSLYVFEVTDTNAQKAGKLSRLTDGKCIGPSIFSEPAHVVSGGTGEPRVTGLFTGKTFNGGISTGPPVELMLNFDPLDPSCTPLLSSATSSGLPAPFFMSISLGKGRIYLSSVNQDASVANLANYFSMYHASRWLPMMMTLRSVYGEAAWHAPVPMANLTVDDPPFANTNGFNFQAVLENMRSHSYHMTIAYIPNLYTQGKDDPEIEKLVREEPGHFSAVQHGDFHTPYEFFGYSAEDSASICRDIGYCGFPYTPLEQQKELVADGLTKFELMCKGVGISRSRVMVFPYGISPEPTLDVLSGFGYAATVNGQTAPLLSMGDTSRNASLFPARSSSSGFAYAGRFHPYVNDTIRSGPNFARAVLDLYVGKPALMYTHVKELFGQPSNFNDIADSLNSLAIPLEWRSLGDICSKLYLVKSNIDGTDSIHLFGNALNVTNQGDIPKQIHVFKLVRGGVKLRVERTAGLISSHMRGDTLFIDLSLDPAATANVILRLPVPPGDMAVDPNSARLNGDTVQAEIRNFSDSTSVCPVAVFEDTTGGRLIAIRTMTILGHQAVPFVARLNGFRGRVRIEADPAAILDDPDRSNNAVSVVPVNTTSGVVLDDYNYADSPLRHGWNTDRTSDSAAFHAAFDTLTKKRVLIGDPRPGSGSVTIRRSGFWKYLSVSTSILVREDPSSELGFTVELSVQDSAGNSKLVRYPAGPGPGSHQNDTVTIPLGWSQPWTGWHQLNRPVAQDLKLVLPGFHPVAITSVKLIGNFSVQEILLFPDTGGPTSTPPSGSVREFHLYGNYPNPFNPATTLSFDLPEEALVTIRLYDVLGRMLGTPIDRSELDPGYHTLQVDFRDRASGVYYYSFTAISTRDQRIRYFRTEKMLLVR